jgi:hypothetical protein
MQAKLVQCVKRAQDVANQQQLQWYTDFWGREFGGDFLASEAGRIKYLMMPKSGSKQAREHLLQWYSPEYGAQVSKPTQTQPLAQRPTLLRSIFTGLAGLAAHTSCFSAIGLAGNALPLLMRIQPHPHQPAPAEFGLGGVVDVHVCA